ncbi:MAG TPA: hypothetical protein VNZ64_22225 [Candidatus Acidoferrum sp.]|jgi:hypothetical protein|nr:hypothetical protein [Candidatus Acidoferrum sp.]
MLDYIQRNKEWIISGVGVAILAGVITLVARYWVSKKRPRPLTEPSSVAMNAVRKMPNPSRSLTVQGILDEINSAAPYQKDSIAKNFQGISVRWEGTILDIDKSLFREPSTDVVVRVRIGELLHLIVFTVSVEKYPQLKVLKRGSRIGVSGTIKGCSGVGMYVELDVAEITFPE